MARVTYVKKAQQRYEMKPVLNEDGSPKKTPVMRKDGSQRVTKTGREVFHTQTEPDKTKPLPPYTCEACSKTIEVGQPYKWVQPKSGPYGGRKRIRCETCPGWRSWDLSSSLSARIDQITHETREALNDFETKEDVESAMGEAASSIRELAEEGFGHATFASEELEETADSLDGWADEIDNLDIPELPDPEDENCGECDGTGEIDDPDPADPDDPKKVSCDDCSGSGQITPEEPTDEQMNAWREEVEELISIIDDCPV